MDAGAQHDVRLRNPGQAPNLVVQRLFLATRIGLYRYYGALEGPRKVIIFEIGEGLCQRVNNKIASHSVDNAKEHLFPLGVHRRDKSLDGFFVEEILIDDRLPALE